MSALSRTVDVVTALPWDRVGEPDLGALGRELRLLWIIGEVRQHRLGIGQAAELTAMPRAPFMRLLGVHGVPVIDYPPADL